MAIALPDALNQMEDKSKTFSIKWVSYNRDKNTGGKIISLDRAIRAGAKYNLKDQDMIVVKQQGNSNHPYPIHTHLIVEFNNQPIFI